MDVADHGLGGGPVDARIGDRHAVAKLFAWLRKRLIPGEEIALDHCPHDRGVAGGDLLNDGPENLWLALGLFRRIGMTAVHNQSWRQLLHKAHSMKQQYHKLHLVAFHLAQC